MSALLAIESSKSTNEIVQVITISQKKIEFFFGGVLSHTGVTGNEKVNILVNKAITSAIFTSINTLPFQSIKNNISIHTSKMWQTSWEEIPIAKKLKVYI